MTAVAWVLALGIVAYLLIVHTRRALILFGIVGGLIAVVAGLFFGNLWVEERKSSQQLENMTATAAFDTTKCSDTHPILITIRNNNDRDATSYTFDYLGFRPNYSRPLYDSDYGQAEADFIISAGHGATSCWSVPNAEYDAAQTTIDANPPASLRWEAHVRSVRLAQ